MALVTAPVVVPLRPAAEDEFDKIAQFTAVKLLVPWALKAEAASGSRMSTQIRDELYCAVAVEVTTLLETPKSEPSKGSSVRVIDTLTELPAVSTVVVIWSGDAR